jgi:hypothetical protein
MLEEFMDFEDENEKHLEALKKAMNRSDLVLFLGAGASMSAGAPSWNELLRRLTYSMLVEEAGVRQEEADPQEMRQLFGHFRRRSPLILARFLRQYFGDRFREAVRQALYQDLEEKQTSPLLEEIARLATPPRTGTGLYAIASYNFDDLLERAIARRQIAYHVVMGPGGHPGSYALPIYHVQGYLPMREEDHPVTGQPGDLVFSEESYHLQYLNPYSWSNLTQLNLLRDRTGLFVGLSMTDPNLRRLLDVVHEQDPHHVHYAIFPTPTAEAERLSGGESENVDQITSSRMAYALRNLEDRVASSLGLQLLWADRYDLIPGMLASLR